MSSHPEHSGLEVFLVAGQVYKSDNLGGLLAYFGPVQASSVTVWLIYHLEHQEMAAELIHSIALFFRCRHAVMSC